MIFNYFDLMCSSVEFVCKGTHLVQYKELFLLFVIHNSMPQSCCQASQNHCPVACGPIKKFYDDYNVVFMCQKIMQYSYMYAHRKIDT